jgi:hypothetical protein
MADFEIQFERWINQKVDEAHFMDEPNLFWNYGARKPKVITGAMEHVTMFRITGPVEYVVLWELRYLEPAKSNFLKHPEFVGVMIKLTSQYSRL